MKRYYFYLCLLLLSCAQEDKSGLFQVRGRVFYNTNAAAKVTVSIDDFVTLIAETSEDGSFVIDNVSPGEHKLVIQKTFQRNGSTAFTEKTYQVLVSADVELENLRLPNAVFLSKDRTDASSVSLHWSQTNDLEFREYKLYRHTTSGLDETTGLLVHVSTSMSDTVFVDEDVFPNTSYFYRVYVMDNFGKIGGSNIVGTKTDSKELIVDGSFESLTSMNESIHWTFYGCPYNEWKSNHDEAFEGSKSIEITTQGDGFCGLYFENKHSIAIDDVIPGQKVRFTFKYKGATSSMYLSVHGIVDGNDLGIIGSDSEWKTYSRDFMVVEELNSWNLYFVFSIDPAKSLTGTTILVDEVSLKAVD